MFYSTNLARECYYSSTAPALSCEVDFNSVIGTEDSVIRDQNGSLLIAFSLVSLQTKKPYHTVSTSRYLLSSTHFFYRFLGFCILSVIDRSICQFWFLDFDYHGFVFSLLIDYIGLDMSIWLWSGFILCLGNSFESNRLLVSLDMTQLTSINK